MLYGSFVSVISLNRRLNLLLGLWKKMMKSMVVSRWDCFQDLRFHKTCINDLVSKILKSCWCI
ncbi:hypothetical protein HanRHA438_Chr05g0242741 [Helianthus annuus]|nr:hypothetical protein HanRHA438_Chr05g0242741 [Helianthus annuus]